MSPLFDQTTRSTRPRTVSNGGLSGFVQVDQLIWDRFQANKSTWPRRRKHRPPPIDVGIDGSLLLTTLTTTSLVMHGCRTPVTPGTPGAIKSTPAVRTITPDRVSLPMSRYNLAGQSPGVCPSVPDSSPQKLELQPVELPGSLLLPSQGFPQTEPPVTPSRQIFKHSCSTDSSSTICSTPGLSTCSTGIATEMDILKSFPPKKIPAKSTMPPASTSSVHKMGKPFSAMTAEDLIQCLPECSPSVISNTWVPAMVREFRKIKVLLQDASKMKLDANVELGNFSKEIESISNDARKISATYEHALLRAESLAERDTKNFQEKLGKAETALCEALTAIDGQQDIITEKEEVIKALQHTSDAIVHILGTFIEEILPYSEHSLEKERVHEVRQLIADYSPAAGGSRSPLQLSSSILRIPQTTFHAHLQSLHEIHAKVRSYRRLAQGQNDRIKSQSTELDHRVIECEECLKTIKERDHEIELLVDQNNAQKKTIEDFESGEKVSGGAKLEHERSVKLRQNMDWTIKNLKMAHAKEIEYRDAEINNLRQKLSYAWEEVLARKADVKNAISQTQALLASPDLREVGPDKLSPKGRRMLGKRKAKSHVLPSSRSMLSLSLSESTLGSGTLDSPDAPHSAVAYEAGPKPHLGLRSSRIDDQGWGCGIARKRSIPTLRRAVGALGDLKPGPRNGSLGAVSHDPRVSDMELLETTVKGSVDESAASTSINTEKALPIPPEAHSECGSIGNSDCGHSVTEEVLLDLLPPEVPSHNFGTPLSPRSRVLSGIPEVSGEDAESQNSSPSVTSSSEEVYRKGIDALNMIEFMRESDMREGLDVLDHEGNDYGPVELGVANEVQVERGRGKRLH